MTRRSRTSTCALTVVALLLFAGLGCRPADPLAEIRAQHDRREFAASIEPLRELLTERPEDPETNFLYGQALVMTRREALATWALRKAMEDPEWTVRAGLQLAYSALATSDFNEVVEAADRVLERDPENIAALIARANAHAYWRKEPEKALADASRVLELNPDEIDAMKPRILALLQLSDTAAARAALDDLGRRIAEAESESPPELHAWYCATQAVFAEDTGDLDLARKRWAGCLEADPASPDVVTNAIEFYDGQGEGERAIELLRVALDQAPAHYLFRKSLAERLRHAGQLAEGDALLREATEGEDPGFVAAVWLDVGRYRLRAGDPPGAAEAMARALELAEQAGPVPPQYPFEYAEALLLSKQFARSLELADALTVPAHRHLIRARVAQERGDPALALEEFSESLRLWPNNPWARYYAARAAEDVGDFDRALEEYRSAIRIDPGATDARTRAGALLIAEGKPRFALQLLHEMAGDPLELEGQLLALRTIAQIGSAEELRAAQARFQQGGTAPPALAIAEIAEGIARGSGGPAAALRLLRNAEGVDFAAPEYAPALRVLVRVSHEGGGRATPAELAAALARHPEAGVFQEIRGLDLELSGAVEPAQAAYRRALEIEPGDARALAGLGRLSLASDPAEAVAFFERAAAANPSDPRPALLAAQALVAAGRRDDAERRLDVLLDRHPLEAEAAALRATLDLDRGTASDRTLERARRAARLGGGADALALLGRVHAQRGEAEQAEQFAERARVLREKSGAAG